MFSIASFPLIGGLIALTIAIVAWFGDRRRRRRKDPDAVGFMPWTSVSFFSLFAACVLLGFAARQWLQG